MQRTTRSVRLTEAGQRLVEQTRRELCPHRPQRGRARATSPPQPRGLLRVTAPVALGRQHVAPLSRASCARSREVRVELDLSDRLLTLAHEGFDLAVRHTSAPPDTHVAWKLCASRSLLVASRAYLRATARRPHPAELANHACLPYLRPGPRVWQFERGAGKAQGEPERVSVTVQGPLRANNSEVLRDAALAGLGIALLPDFSAAHGAARQAAAVLLPAWRPVGVFGDAIYAMHPWSPTTPKAVQALVAHLRSGLSAGFGA